MHRGKRLLFTAHCILNQNSVIRDWERAIGGFNRIIEMLLTQNIGILQLPCPEFTFLGEDRRPMTKDEYNTEDYRSHSREILKIILKQFREYQAHGYEIIGILGIGGSPSCDSLRNQGVFMEELMDLLYKEGITIITFDIPEDYINGQDHSMLKELEEFIKKKI